MHFGLIYEDLSTNPQHLIYCSLLSLERDSNNYYFIIRGFVFRGWMDYLTFGWYGTGGWASLDGTIHCVEQAYDFESEKFLVSLLKHEAQHTVDMKRFPEITPR